MTLLKIVLIAVMLLIGDPSLSFPIPIHSTRIGQTKRCRIECGKLFSKSRRDVLVIGTSLVTHPILLSLKASAASDVESTKPLAEVPMVRLRLPRNSLGREYIVVKLKIDGKGPYDFMVDSGLTTEMITPHLKDVLNIKTDKAQTLTGLAAGGSTENPLVNLEGVSLCCGKFAKDNESFLKLPPLHAVVTDFVQEHIDPEHDVEGMIGMELIEMFDVDFDFPKEKIRFWARQKSKKDDLVPIPAAVLNESGLEGIRVKCLDQKSGQPMLGIIDCGSSFSIMNTAAARLLDINNEDLKNSPKVMGIGIDGSPLAMPTISTQFTFVGNAKKEASSNVVSSFDGPPPEFQPWDPVTVAIGDLPVFSSLLGDGKHLLNVPTVLIGLDILAQRRFILETGKGRARNIFVAPK